MPPFTTQLQKPHTEKMNCGVVVAEAVVVTVVAMVGTISDVAVVAAFSFDVVVVVGGGGVGVGVAAVAAVVLGSSSPITINDIACQAPDNL